MDSFFHSLPHQQAIEVQQLARLMYATREARKDVLTRYAVEDEAALLARIGSGELESLPAYDDYLSARLLGQASAAARARVAQLTGQPQQVEEPLHLKLAEQVQAEFSEALDSAPILLQNALQLVLDNGVEMEIRYADAEHYSLVWQWGEGGFRIDTAPGATPSRLILDDGSIAADTLTQPGAEPWQNLRAVLAAVVANPMLD